MIKALKRGVVESINELSQPDGKDFYLMESLIFDATIIVLIHAGPEYAEKSFDVDIFDIEQLNSMIKEDPGIYEECLARMQERITRVKLFLPKLEILLSLLKPAVNLDEKPTEVLRTGANFSIAKKLGGFLSDFKSELVFQSLADKFERNRVVSKLSRVASLPKIIDSNARAKESRRNFRLNQELPSKRNKNLNEASSLGKNSKGDFKSRLMTRLKCGIISKIRHLTECSQAETDEKKAKNLNKILRFLEELPNISTSQELPIYQEVNLDIFTSVGGTVNMEFAIIEELEELTSIMSSDEQKDKWEAVLCSLRKIFNIPVSIGDLPSERPKSENIPGSLPDKAQIMWVGSKTSGPAAQIKDPTALKCGIISKIEKVLAYFQAAQYEKKAQNLNETLCFLEEFASLSKLRELPTYQKVKVGMIRSIEDGVYMQFALMEEVEELANILSSDEQKDKWEEVLCSLRKIFKVSVSMEDLLTEKPKPENIPKIPPDESISSLFQCIMDKIHLEVIIYTNIKELVKFAEAEQYEKEAKKLNKILCSFKELFDITFSDFFSMPYSMDLTVSRKSLRQNLRIIESIEDASLMKLSIIEDIEELIRLARFGDNQKKLREISSCLSKEVFQTPFSSKISFNTELLEQVKSVEKSKLENTPKVLTRKNRIVAEIE